MNPYRSAPPPVAEEARAPIVADRFALAFHVVFFVVITILLELR